MLKDLRYALRQLVRSPGFTTVIVLTLALGMGATTAVYSLINAILLRPLAYPDASRIITAWSLDLRTSARYPVSGQDFVDWRNESRALVNMSLYLGSEASVVIGSSADSVRAVRVSDGFFSVLGARPRAGHLWNEEEMRGQNVAVVGEGFVRKHFGGDSGRALGASFKLRGRLLHVVGVMADGFSFPDGTEVWEPFDTAELASTSRGGHNYRVIARLRSGTSLAQAQSELQSIAGRLAQGYPRTNRNKGASLVALPDLLVEGYRSTLWILFGAVGIVLLVACANTANLLGARGIRRTREVAVRTALGASAGRVTRQLFTESLALALLAGLVGVIAAGLSLNALLALAPAGIPRLDSVRIDRSTLGFAMVVCLGVCLATGVVPALQANRIDLASTLRAGGRGIAGARGRVRSALVITQLALSVILLAGAGLLWRSFEKMNEVDPGYRPQRLLVMKATVPTLGEPWLHAAESPGEDSEASRALAFFDQLSRRGAGVPGVLAVSFADSLPIDDVGSSGTYQIEGRPQSLAGSPGNQHAIWRVVGPEYFSVLAVPIREGRQLDQRDTFQAPGAVVINASMARAAWPGKNPIGQRIHIGWDRQELPMTVVGVVADTRQQDLGAPIEQELYVPAAQHPKISSSMKVVARTALEPVVLFEEFRRLAHILDPEVPVRFTTAEALVADSMGAPRFRTVLMGLFAALALLLAIVGVASVMACLVAEKHAEIGLRMAMGAQPRTILRQFLARGFRLGLSGLALGLLGAFTGARLLRGLLYGVTPLDPTTLFGTSLVLLVAVIAAAAIPAFRAARVSPMTALRRES